MIQPISSRPPVKNQIVPVIGLPKVEAMGAR